MVRAGRPGGDAEPSLTKHEKGGSSHMADLSNNNLSRAAKLRALRAEQPGLDLTTRGMSAVKTPRLPTSSERAAGGG
jgi:hypothetical protein